MADRIETSAERERRWRAEGDMDTLMRAEEIRKDPKRLQAAATLAKEKVVELATVAGEAKKP